MKRLILFVLVLLIVGLSLFLYLRPRPVKETFSAMGTQFSITVKSRNAKEDISAAKQRILALEKLLNRFDKKSEIGRLNRGEKFNLSEDTRKCLALAEKAKQMTGGAFDVRYAGPLNLDGIGKGFAVEEARRLLLKRRVKSAIIDCGSSIAVIGDKYRIGVKHPRKKDELLGIITLNPGEGLSTSGDYEQGRHIIDPRSKKPAAKCQAVTVVCEDAGLADGLSTGIFVMDPIKSVCLAQALDIKVLIVSTDGKIYEHFGPQLRLFVDKI